VVEVHDATSPSEIMFLIELGLGPGQDAGKWIDDGPLELDGRSFYIMLKLFSRCSQQKIIIGENGLSTARRSL
jgi:hypothetical protein